MSAYTAILFLHSSVRWLVLALLIAVLVRTARGWAAGRAWTPVDEKTQLRLVSFADLQLLLGLSLYVVASPITTAFFAAPKAAMRDPTLRFFGVEHITAMVLGIAALHVGRGLSRRLSDGKRHRRVFGWTLTALLLIVAGVPWPFLRYGRPLLRLRMAEVPRDAPAACPPSYRTRCLVCHGGEGRGDGPAASGLKPPPRNFADPSWGTRSDDELAAIIREGGLGHRLSPAMPAHADLSEAELRSLVKCLRSFRLQR